MPVPVRLIAHTLCGALVTLIALLLIVAPAAEARTLTQGDRGAKVRSLQKLLRQAGF